MRFRKTKKVDLTLEKYDFHDDNLKSITIDFDEQIITFTIQTFSYERNEKLLTPGLLKVTFRVKEDKVLKVIADIDYSVPAKIEDNTDENLRINMFSDLAGIEILDFYVFERELKWKPEEKIKILHCVTCLGTMTVAIKGYTITDIKERLIKIKADQK